jgi:hypothetical protein
MIVYHSVRLFCLIARATVLLYPQVALASSSLVEMSIRWALVRGAAREMFWMCSGEIDKL